MNTHDLPEGIEVDIRHKDGVARQSFTEYGRSVHFAHGTKYWISITNKRKEHAAFDLYIDGRKANLTTTLLYRGRHQGPDGDIKSRPRIIKGFELTRDSVELAGDKFATVGTIELFIANRPGSDASAATDNRIGTIKFDFFATRYARRQPGRTQQLAAPNNTPNPSMQHNARTGVLSTGSGSVEPKRGEHRQGEKSGHRPVADHAKPLDPPSHEITIGEVAEKYPLLPAAPSAAPLPPAELRYDTDGGLYTRAEFIEEYDGAAEWNAAVPLVVRTRPIGV